LSRQIQQLEDELGVQLLLRDRRDVSLTGAGRVFLQESKIVMAHLEDAVTATRSLKRAVRERRIDIGLLRAPVDATHLESVTLFSEPFHVLIRKTDPIAKFKKVTLDTKNTDGKTERWAFEMTVVGGLRKSG
jgi:DNA-binding transcriptional LysR family regulator